MAKLSVVVNTYNEAGIVSRALSSIKDIAGEIVIVDMQSQDNIKEIAKKYNARFFSHRRVYYVEPVRNFAISKTSGDWVLLIDPDEVISNSLKQKIQKIITSSSLDYYRLPRKNMIFGKWIKHAKWWPDYNIRLFKRGKVVWSEIIHSVPTTIGKGGDLKAEEKYAITHHHYESIDQFLEKMTRYTTAQSVNRVNEGYKFNFANLIKRPVGEFVSRYFQEEGYKDGVHGLALCGLQAFSEFVTELKIWESEKFQEVVIDLDESVREIKKSEADLRYWEADSLFRQNKSWTQRVKRKFKLP